VTPLSDKPAKKHRVTDAVLSYLDHDSWRCGHPPTFYLTGDPLPEGTCYCGLVDELHAVGLHALADEYDPRKQEAT
jgi:hypothetical protein